MPDFKVTLMIYYYYYLMFVHLNLRQHLELADAELVPGNNDSSGEVGIGLTCRQVI